MKRIVSLMLALSGLLVANWYVAPGGSDANPGTEAQPWATIAHAGLIATGADETCFVKAGTYHRAVGKLDSIFGSGTEGHPFVFASYDGWSTILGNAVNVRGTYSEFDHFYLHCPANDSQAGVTVDPSLVRIYGNNVEQYPETLGLNGTTGIFFHSANTWNTADSNVVHGWGGKHNNESLGDRPHGHGIYNGYGKHLTCSRNTCYHNASYNLQMTAHVESSECYNNVCYKAYDKAGIVIDGGYNKVWGNVCYGNKTEGIKLMANGDTFEHFNSCWNNTVYGNGECGITDEHWKSDTVYNNLSIDNNKDYVLYDSTVFDYNVLWPDSNTHYAGSATFPQAIQYNIAGGRTMRLRMSEFYDSTGQGQHCFAADPMCVDTALADFHLSPGSSLVDAGGLLTPARRDIDRTICPQVGVVGNSAVMDIGAYERWVGGRCKQTSSPVMWGR